MAGKNFKYIESERVRRIPIRERGGGGLYSMLVLIWTSSSVTAPLWLLPVCLGGKEKRREKIGSGWSEVRWVWVWVLRPFAPSCLSSEGDEAIDNISFQLPDDVHVEKKQEANLESNQIGGDHLEQKHLYLHLHLHAPRVDWTVIHTSRQASCNTRKAIAWSARLVLLLFLERALLDAVLETSDSGFGGEWKPRSNP